MTLFELLFILLFLASVISVITAIVVAIRGSRARALRILVRLAVCAAIYVGIVYVATAFSTRRVYRLGEEQCFDEWCVAVDGVQRAPKQAVTDYEVQARVLSHSRGRPQREGLATDIYLLDSEWKRYDPIRKGDEIPLNVLLQPGQSLTTHRSFELPSSAHNVAVVVGHDDPFPICLIIGECGAFHKRPVVQLE